MFVDKVMVEIKGGDGGNGEVAFRREKYEPHGGPSGGDGGKGGDVIFEVDEGLSTLLDFKGKKILKASKGAHGEGSNKHGKNGKDLVVKVPPGTIIKDENGNVIGDLKKGQERFVAAKGGKGGKGNAKFVTSKNRAPRMAEKGEPGEEKELTLELRLIADVGLVGFPNAGKSTFLSVVSKASPRIADYPFTTLIPNLGVCENKRGDRYVIADIPGLIEGAHEGRGLGHEFLRHVERTRVLVYILDMSGFEGRDPLNDFEKLKEELKNYSSQLEKKPKIIAANKMDLTGEAEENLERLKRYYANSSVDTCPISCITKEGIDDLLNKIGDKLEKAPLLEEPVEDLETEDAVKDFAREKDYPSRGDERPVVEKEDSVYIIKHKKLERIAAMTDFENEEAFERFQRIIYQMGVEELLREKGIKEGELVKIGQIEFEYYE